MSAHMNEIIGDRSSSGVFIAENFRDNLIVDRYDPCFATMRASKLKHLRSENSEDVLSWNVFRSMSKISPPAWLSLLAERAFDAIRLDGTEDTTVELWKPVPPPLSLLKDGDEGISEVDIVIESPAWVWFIEAKYTSDISSGTTTRPERDQIIRNIDVGSYYAGTRDFYFALLIHSAARSPKGVEIVKRYRDFEVVRKQLPHRTDGLRNQKAVGLLQWSDVAGVILRAGELTPRADEKHFADQAIAWLYSRGIVGAKI